jgi:hypothetical protein
MHRNSRAWRWGVLVASALVVACSGGPPPGQNGAEGGTSTTAVPGPPTASPRSTPLRLEEWQGSRRLRHQAAHQRPSRTQRRGFAVAPAASRSHRTDR